MDRAGRPPGCAHPGRCPAHCRVTAAPPTAHSGLCVGHCSDILYGHFGPPHGQGSCSVQAEGYDAGTGRVPRAAHHGKHSEVAPNRRTETTIPWDPSRHNTTEKRPVRRGLNSPGGEPGCVISRARHLPRRSCARFLRPTTCPRAHSTRRSPRACPCSPPPTRRTSCITASSIWFASRANPPSARTRHLHERCRLHPRPTDSDHAPAFPKVLDLDETLVYSKRLEPGTAPLGTQIFVRGSPFDMVLRPGLREFLTRAAASYIICMYTMGDADYAQAVLRVIDPECLFFRGDSRPYCSCRP